MDDQSALGQTIELMSTSLQPSNADFKEGVRSFLEKRPPTFAPLRSASPHNCSRSRARAPWAHTNFFPLCCVCYRRWFVCVLLCSETNPVVAKTQMLLNMSAVGSKL